MRRLVLFAAALFASPSAAQIVNPPVVSIDTTNLATKGEIAQAQASADAASSAASAANTVAVNAAAAAAAACQPMAAIPPVEVVGGTTGTGTNCRLANAANNRISRTGIFTTGANGMLLCSGSTTCVWDTALPAGAASYPMFFTDIGVAGSMLTKCKVITSTNTGFSAQCRQEAASVNLLGAAVSILAPSGVQVYALSLPSTQSNR